MSSSVPTVVRLTDVIRIPLLNVEAPIDVDLVMPYFPSLTKEVPCEAQERSCRSRGERHWENPGRARGEAWEMLRC